MSGAGLEAPQLLPRPRVECEELACCLACKYEVSGSGEHGGQKWILRVVSPGAAAGKRIESIQVSGRLAAGRRLELERSAVERLPFRGLFLMRGDGLAPFDCCAVEPASPRRVGGLIPAAPAAHAGTQLCGTVRLRLPASQQVSVLVDAAD